MWTSRRCAIKMIVENTLNKRIMENDWLSKSRRHICWSYLEHQVWCKASIYIGVKWKWLILKLFILLNCVFSFQQGITPLDATAWDSGRPHLKGIKHFQERMSTTNGFVRNDSDPSICIQKLTYQVSTWFVNSFLIIASNILLSDRNYNYIIIP